MKNPEERYQTGKALSEALKKLLEEKELVAAAKTPPAETKSKILKLSLVVVLLLAIIGGIAFLVSNRKSGGSKLEAVRESIPVVTTALTVESSPQGAEIFIDGAPKGITPVKLEVTAGKHEVKLSLQHYHEWEASVQVEQGKQTPLFVHMMPIEAKNFK